MAGVYNKRMGNLKLKGAGALLGGAFVVSTFGIWARFVTPMFGVVAQNVVRFLLAAAIMAAVIWISKTGKFRGYSRRQYGYMVLLGVASFALGLLFVLSVTSTKVANTFSLIYAGSIVTSFIAGTFLLREKVTPVKIIAITVALCGLVMYSPGLLALNVGLAAGIGAGMCDGISNMLRKQLRGVNRDVAVTYQYAVAGGLALPVLFVWPGEAIHTVSFWPVVAMVIFAVASLAFGKLLLYGFSHFDVNVGGVVLAMQIFFAMLLGFACFGEVPAANELFGSLLIFSAVSLAVLDKEKITFFIRKIYEH